MSFRALIAASRVDALALLLNATDSPSIGRGGPRRQPTSPRRTARVLLLAMLAMCAAAVHASCGSASCTLMTDRYAQGSGEGHQGWSIDLRYEVITQDRLRGHSGTAGEVDDEEEATMERRTGNHNLVATLEYGIDGNWSAIVRAPLVQRDHRHLLLDEEGSESGQSERWRFTEAGDTQTLVRRRFESADHRTAVAVLGGLKLPTGSFDEENDDGIRAERALQPGTGTTDLIAGVAGRYALGMNSALIGQAGFAEALASREHFEPGTRLNATLGWSHAISRKLGTVLQINVAHRDRDRGAQAEPGHSGSTTVDLSPGITIGIADASTLYAYVQIPLYQDVNGEQLMPRSAFAVGWTSDF
jgi:hypothetical protein